MILNEVSIIAAPTNRSKAYLQLMSRNNIYPAECILLTSNKDLLEIELTEYMKQEPLEGNVDFFNPTEPILFTLTKEKIPFSFCETENINDTKVVEKLNKLDTPYIIYSGKGGQILKKEILNLGKRFLHIHPGIVPEYRGSTTLYYSLLKEGKIGASAIFLEENIDTGPVIAIKKFDIPKYSIDIDNVLDPYIRALLLIEVLNSYVAKGMFEKRPQNEKQGETYFIIHPVLKHIAILSQIESKKGFVLNE